MRRNLDVAALRSFLAVADSGVVTRAATQLNLTQPAVSLQIKRLEDTFGCRLFERSARGATLTSQGEQLVGYARRLVALNDETWQRVGAVDAVGEIHLGAPDDLLYPRVPLVLRAFTTAHPRLKVQLHSGQTIALKERFAKGDLDIILTTEADTGAGSETLASEPLVWIGAHGGRAWQRRPLPLGTVAGCIFNRASIDTLSAAGFDWQLELDSVTNPAMDVSIQADIVVRLAMQSTVPEAFEVIPHEGALPTLPSFYINMYVTDGPRRRSADLLAERLRGAYAAPVRIAAE
jgi:DNA-binding transcriptional LysR family regulator